jgi:prepilin-type N-terminal cleavage/methylation domain-containing protein
MMQITSKGFSLVEVMVASLIFSIAVIGIYASLATVKEQSLNISDKGLGAALCAQQFLESRRAAVDMRDWNAAGSLLAITGGLQNGAVCNQSGVNYTVQYQIAAAGGNARKATVIVTWP